MELPLSVQLTSNRMHKMDVTTMWCAKLKKCYLFYNTFIKRTFNCEVPQSM